MSLSALDAARAAHKESAPYRLMVPILNNTLGLVLGEPEGLKGYSPFALQAAGMAPDIDKDVEFLAASCTEIVALADGKEEPLTSDSGEPLSDVCAVASALTGSEITDRERAIMALFTSGEPPTLKQHQVANAAFMHRTALTAGMRKALEPDPEA